MTFNRRELWGVAGGLVLGGLGTYVAQRLTSSTPAPGPENLPSCPMPEASPSTPAEALARLQEGNRRFLEGRSHHRPGAAAPRLGNQDYRPFAVIVACSDCPLDAETLFDDRGGLFVVRQVAHRLDAWAVSSIEYAVSYLKVPLVLVLGHSRCSALAAVLGAAAQPEVQPPASLDYLSKELNSVVREVRRDEPDAIDKAVVANVRVAVRQLRISATLRPAIREGRLLVLGGQCVVPPGRFESIDVS